MKILKTFENFNVPSKGRWQSYKENLSSGELKLQSKDFTYDTYNQWKDNLADEDEINFFKKIADKVQNGATTKEKFNQIITRSFNTIEWKSRPEIKQSQSEKKPNELPKSNQETKSADDILIDNINDLEDEDIYSWSRLIPHEPYYKGDEEKVMNGLLDVIKKVNPNADFEKKKMSLSRAFDETCENLRNASQKSFSAARGIKDFFEENLSMFR